MGARVVLAYSGGLDTSVAVRWMGEEWGCEVIALAVDVGQGGDFETIRKRALSAGAIEAEVIDARARYAAGFVVPAVRANALYEGRYPLVSALSRPIIVEELVAAARRHGATAVAHGCTGKGNDQVRFEVSTRALAPDLDVLAPTRDWDFNRETAMDYAAEHGIPIEQTKKSPYSIDENLWGRAIECGAIEDPWAQAPDDIWTLTRPPEGGPPAPSEVVIGFEAGVPITLDGAALPAHELIAGSRREGRRLRLRADRHGREPPGRHQEPGGLRVPRRPGADPGPRRPGGRLPRARRHAGEGPAGVRASPSWSTTGCGTRRCAGRSTPSWSTPRSTSPARCASPSTPAAATCRGRRAPKGLYDHGLATYDASDTFRHRDAEGFVRLWGLSVETWARRQGAGQ